MSARDKAAKYMGFEPTQELDVELNPYQAAGNPQVAYGHVALNMPGGWTLWLNIMQLESHDCVDIRTFRDDEQYAQGVMAVHKGQRVIGKHDHRPALAGHGWPAGYNVTLMSDRAPSSTQDAKPYTERQE